MARIHADSDLGSDISIIVSSSGEYWRVIELWRVLENIGGFWRVVESFGEYWRGLESIGQFLDSIGEFWRVLESIREFW